MLVNELLRKQKELDDNIIHNMDIKLDDMTLFENRILAFVVEVAEFANEVRTFKHWSKKDPSPREVILEEYVDALHFLLSLTNSFKHFDVKDDIQHLMGDIKRYEGMPRSNSPKADMNLGLIALASIATEVYYNALDDSRTASLLLVDLWDMFIYVGHLASFTLEEIEEAYYQKNKVNYVRQATGY